MRAKRLTWFLIMIVVGLAGGLAYGWLIDPVQYVDTAPESLHPAYKADFVLMVAEVYQVDGDLPGAMQRLALLGSLSAERVVADALLTARTSGYSLQDVTLIENLSQAVKTAAPPAMSPTTAEPTTGGQP